jgi:uncharacterized protein YjbI with pentapeptide repeats
MPFSFKSLFSGSRSSTLTLPLDPGPREDAATQAQDAQPADTAKPPVANADSDPLQQALLREFLAQEFLVQPQAAPTPAADAVVSPALDELLAKAHETKPFVADTPAPELKIETAAQPAAASKPAPIAPATKVPDAVASPKSESAVVPQQTPAATAPAAKTIAVDAATAPKAPEPAAKLAPAPIVAPATTPAPPPHAVSAPALETKSEPPAPKPEPKLETPVKSVEPDEPESPSVADELPQAAKNLDAPTDIDELLASIGSVTSPQLNNPTGELFEVHAQTVPALADVAPDAYVLKPRVDPNEWALEETLAAHKEWVDSHGALGTRADLRKGSYESTELISVNLRYADLQDINLRAADLLLADLREACLVRADFSEACLVGTNLEGANLEGASLENSMGLVPRQIAGANVHEASLPAPVLEFRALTDFARAAVVAVRLFSTTLVLSVIALVMIFKTRDVQLLADSGILSFIPSRALAGALPSDQLYLVAPIVLFVVYLWFLYNLQRVWDAVLELPAVFPDGRTLNSGGSRIISGLLRTHFHWMNAHAPSTRRIEKTVSVLLAYWTVPLVILIFWARYLTVQDIHGTMLHEVLILLSISVAFYCTTRTGRSAEAWLTSSDDRHPILDKLKAVKPVHGLAIIFGILTFLSLGTIYGVPRDTERAPQYGASNIRRWAPAGLWAVGIDPYAELTEASISRKPEGFDGSDAQLANVTGARLVGSNFRYAQAYGVFLANAHLFRSNFNGAFMSQADMRGADLSQSTLENTNLDRAQMSRVNLDRASLVGATLSRTDLRNANLSYATLTGSTLIDARMDGASLYGSHLENASIIRGNMNKADLRDAHLDGANLEHSDLREAYFWSAKLPGANLRNAQLATAIFIDADLSRADLSGAQFNGTVLNGANLRDAILDGADLRGALQLSAAQICSTKSRNGAQFDDALQLQIDNLCGTGPHVATPGPAPTAPAASSSSPAQKPASH